MAGWTPVGIRTAPGLVAPGPEGHGPVLKKRAAARRGFWQRRASERGAPHASNLSRGLGQGHSAKVVSSPPERGQRWQAAAQLLIRLHWLSF